MTCSANAYRSYPYTCQASDGSTVPNEYCFENPTPGGMQNYDVYKTDYGNYAGCSYRWDVAEQQVGCHAAGFPSSTDFDAVAGSPSGPVYYSNYIPTCIRSDGRYLYGADAAQCTNAIGPVPEGIVQSDTCHKVFVPAGYNAYPGSGIGDPSFGYCREDDGKVLVVSTMRQNQTLPAAYEDTFGKCVEMGATCASTRVTLSSNYAKEPYNTLQIVCTTGQAHLADSDRSYADACADSTGVVVPASMPTSST